jgi:hypothetical protein
MPDTTADRPRMIVFALAALWLLGAGFWSRASSQGDGPEYYLMSESLLRHLSPDARPEDLQSLTERAARWHLYVNFDALSQGYFEAANASRYSYHFWGYSLLTVPARALLRLVGANDLKGAQITNALVFLYALHQALFATALPRRAALGLGLLALFSPAVWFVLWTHPEAFCFALVLLALVWARAGRRHLPILAVALAAMQNPPLLLLLVPLWVRGCLAPGRLRIDWRAALKASLAALPIVLPPLFFFVRFGTPSVIARNSASASLVSLRRALELFFDLNLGLLPYAPLILVLFLVGLLLSCRSWARARVAWSSVIVLLAMALASSATTNWNHGTAGPSRYTIWMLPLLLMGVAEAYAAALYGGSTRARGMWTAAVVLAISFQILIVFSRGGLRQSSDWIAHSYAARFVLRHAPAWYNPSPAIFVERTLGRMNAGETDPAIYKEERGCRKAWVRAQDVALVRTTCGLLPARAEAFFKAEPASRFRYVDFD